MKTRRKVVFSLYSCEPGSCFLRQLLSSPFVLQPTNIKTNLHPVGQNFKSAFVPDTEQAFTKRASTTLSCASQSAGREGKGREGGDGVTTHA